jgi:tRNA nucleotidyltransferase (CCA-adding enzyme)
MIASTQQDLQTFLTSVVNLDADRLARYRDQVRYLRERLAAHVAANPEFGLYKMLHSGSARKGTAISTLNDMDVAVYLRPEQIPDHLLPHVLDYVRSLLIKVYPQMEPSQFSIGRHALQVNFKSSGLTVDVVPVIPNGKPDDRGELATSGTQQWVETSIPLHLKFIQNRKDQHTNFRELIRLTKWWRDSQEIRFKSFLIELLWAHLFDTGQVRGEDLGEALLGFMGYIIRSGLQERVSFTDYYNKPEPANDWDPVQVFDPVNPSNNVGAGIDSTRRSALVRSCQEAFEALASAQTAHTCERARLYYQRVFGTRYTV